MNCKRCGARSRYDARTTIIRQAAFLSRCATWRSGIARSAATGGKDPTVEQLHRAIALAVARKPARLTGPEVRFLRKVLGWSGVDFARHIGVSPEIVSKWENDREAIGAANDRLLRLLVANSEPVSHYPVEELEKDCR